MLAPLRAQQLCGALLALTFACGGSGDGSMTKTMEKAEAKDQAEKEAKAAADKKLAEQVKEAKKGVLEHPWKFEDVKAGLKPGIVLDYEMTGTDAKGKPVEDGLHAEVGGQEGIDIKVMEYKKSQADTPAVTQPQGHPLSDLSPFFHVEQNKITLERKETIEVPAGKFDCVVADLSGYFGKHLTVWMIVDKPGIYAQVVEHPNLKNAEPEDPTEITYRLASITRKE